MKENEQHQGRSGKGPLSFERTGGPLDRAIDKLIKLAGHVQRPELIREMIITSLKAGQEGVSLADLKLMNMSLKEMRYTSKVFAPYRSVRKVTVFGSARTYPDEPIYYMARKVGELLAKEGAMVITGGGPGLMQAVNEGAGPEHSFGVNIRLPSEQKANPVLDGLPRSINYKYFFNRKVAFVKEADAVILAPGGFGTLDEAMEILTLVQTGKRAPLPILLLDLPGGTYWRRWEELMREELLGRGAVSASDFFLFRRIESPEEAVFRIGQFYRRYHSLRYVGPRLVIRLKDLPDPFPLDELRAGFADILTPQGDMELSGPLSVEKDEPDILSLPRIVFDFNRKDFGRLVQFIERLNEI
ncbi:MAG: TIGR00730 family Rossman fold protein [Thermodesulfobacteriota bacterium]